MKKSLFILSALVILAIQDLSGQSKWMWGFNAGGNISRVYSDTLANNFSRRNRLGFIAGTQLSYDIRSFVTVTVGLNYVNKGYKVFNDTLPSNASIVQKTNSLNLPIGVVFRQKFSPSSSIHEKFGFIANYSFRKDSIVRYNDEKTPRFRITDVQASKLYPMFYLGMGIGGNTESGDRYEFSVTYNQSFGTDANLNVEYGQAYLKKFPLTYRGGFVQFGFSYYFNLGNFKKSDEYFVD